MNQPRVMVEIQIGPYSLEALTGRRGEDGGSSGVVIRPVGEPMYLPIAIAYGAGVAAALDRIKLVRDPDLLADLPDVTMHFTTVPEPLELPQDFPDVVTTPVIEVDGGVVTTGSNEEDGGSITRGQYEGSDEDFVEGQTGTVVDPGDVNGKGFDTFGLNTDGVEL